MLNLEDSVERFRAPQYRTRFVPHYAFYKRVMRATNISYQSLS